MTCDCDNKQPKCEPEDVTPKDPPPEQQAPQEQDKIPPLEQPDPNLLPIEPRTDHIGQYCDYRSPIPIAQIPINNNGVYDPNQTVPSIYINGATMITNPNKNIISFKLPVFGSRNGHGNYTLQGDETEGDGVLLIEPINAEDDGKEIQVKVDGVTSLHNIGENSEKALEINVPNGELMRWVDVQMKRTDGQGLFAQIGFYRHYLPSDIKYVIWDTPAKIIALFGLEDNPNAVDEQNGFLLLKKPVIELFEKDRQRFVNNTLIWEFKGEIHYYLHETTGKKYFNGEMYTTKALMPYGLYTTDGKRTVPSRYGGSYYPVQYNNQYTRVKSIAAYVYTNVPSIPEIQVREGHVHESLFGP